MTDSTGANDNLAQHLLGEIISGGVTAHLVDAAQNYTDGDTEVSSDSLVSENIAEADLTANSATGFADTATITNDNAVEFDVSGESTTAVEVVVQNQTETGRFVLADETNDPDLSELDTWTLEADTTLYEFGSPA